MLDDLQQQSLGQGEVTQEQTICGIAREIRIWQEAQTPKLSDNALVAHHPALGSTKTYKKLRDGDTSQLDLDEWLPKYEGVLNKIRVESAARKEEIYSDLSFTSEIYRSILKLIHSGGLDRLIIVEGGSGGGKTESLKFVQRQFPGAVILAEADESWIRPAVMVGDLCLATGAVARMSDLPKSLKARLHLLVSAISNRRIVLIDEAHHMSSESLNILKTLLNRTDSVFVIAALDTLWKKLQTNAWQEAKQLIFNRMFDRIRLSGPTVDDASKFLGRRLSIDGDITKALGQIVEIATHHGGMAFLRNIARRVEQLGAGGNADASTLLEAAKHVKQQVEGRK